MSEKKKAGIIGSGIAGLAMAVRLAAKGYEVTVFEASDRVGGKLHEFWDGPYRFDFGPSLFTMPHLVEELFELQKVTLEPNFEYHSLPIICKYFWDDGTQTATFSDLQKTINTLAKDLGESPDKLEEHFSQSKKKYDLVGKTFLEHSLHRWKTWLTGSVANALLHLSQLDVFKTMHQANVKRFANPKTVQLFDRYATYNGSNPYKAPGLLNIIPHFEYGYGAHLPKKGMSQITQSIYQYAVNLGIKFELNSKVTAIDPLHSSKIKGLTLESGASYDFDVVVSNMDAYYTYQELLKGREKAAKLLKQERSSSALIFYWGIDRSFPQFDLHNILFSKDYEREFDHIGKGELYDDPTVYIHITSKYLPEDAPEGHENWFTMINAPYNNGQQDWENMIKVTREKIIQKISNQIGFDLTKHIQTETIVDPRTIENKTLSYTGSLYGTSSNDQWAAFARHPNQSPQYSNLYFIGGSVHPGGGIPLCLLSAKIVDDLITKG